MKCPKCECRNLSITKQEGFSKDYVKECMDCGLVWIKDANNKIWILSEYKND